MSKAKAELRIRKEKARHSLRRFETAKKKADRIKKYRQDAYHNACAGYRVRDSRIVCIHKMATIPEYTKESIEYDGERYIPTYDEDGNRTGGYFRSVYKTVKTVIPEHIAKVADHWEEIELPEFPRRRSTRYRKYLRKIATRKVRNAPLTETYNRGLVKKVFDITWELC